MNVLIIHNRRAAAQYLVADAIRQSNSKHIVIHWAYNNTFTGETHAMQFDICFCHGSDIPYLSTELKQFANQATSLILFGGMVYDKSAWDLPHPNLYCLPFSVNYDFPIVLNNIIQYL